MQSISLSPQNGPVRETSSSAFVKARKLRIRYGAQSHINKVVDCWLSLALMTPSSVLSLAHYVIRILVKKCRTVVLTEGDLAVSPWRKFSLLNLMGVITSI